MTKRFVYILLFAVPMIVPMNDANNPQHKSKRSKMEFKITSSAFHEGDLIPPQYTCDGANFSPPLEWKNPPDGTNTFALLNDDPDAPAGDWVHWIVYNIPRGTTGFKENASSKKLLPPGSIEGRNDSKENCYDGPCPPSGTHRYFFKLFALDAGLSFNASPTKKMLLDAMKGHILAQATLIGKYKRR
jgi:Raf kinase inhibitor-like YbhB/YbcL family protein